MNEHRGIPVPDFFRILLVLFAIGIPGFLVFDATNLTHDHGLLNVQSIAKIVTRRN